MTVRVFVVAPTPMARAGLRSMLAEGDDDEASVVGEASSPVGHETSGSGADVVLLADEYPSEELALAVSDDGTHGLVLLSGDEEEAVLKLRSLPLGGWAVVPPDAPPDELGAAISAAAQGLVALPKALTERLLGEPATVEEPPEPLTARESEVLGLLGGGLSNKMIARELHISEHTVKFHVSSLYAKLGVGNRAEAVSQGARRGLISL